jgi:hypothetical protein
LPKVRPKVRKALAAAPSLARHRTEGDRHRDATEHRRYQADPSSFGGTHIFVDLPLGPLLTTQDEYG